MNDELRNLLDQSVADVSTQISPAEKMHASNKPYYFWVGQSAVRLLRLSLAMANRDERSITHILDMPCGHGRVLRTIRAAFPHAHLTACDVLRDGVDYCAATFNATPIYSSNHPTAAMFPHAGKYDLIFVGSLFTHFNKSRWTEFLKLFNDLLAPGGILVFTSHGPFVAYRMECGFDYGYSQIHFGADNYFWHLLRLSACSYHHTKRHLVYRTNQLWGLLHTTLHRSRQILGKTKRIAMRTIGMQPPPPKPLIPPQKSSFAASSTQSIPDSAPMDAEAIPDGPKELHPKSPIHPLLRTYRQQGFSYLDDGHGFGISLSKPSWVLQQTEALPDLHLLYYLERGWVEHQDAIAVIKCPFTSYACDIPATQ